jgi:hypothetical protein
MSGHRWVDIKLAQRYRLTIHEIEQLPVWMRNWLAILDGDQ